MAVGIFDTGLGGLAVLEAATTRLPDVPFVYLADAEHAPYGTRDPHDIVVLTKTGIERLWSAGCDLILMASNTASAAALRPIQDSWVPADKRVLGPFVPIIEHLCGRDWGDNTPPRAAPVKNIALFGTPVTVNSGAFQRELRFRAIDVQVAAQACGGIVDALSQSDDELVQRLVRSHVAALLQRMPQPDAVVLASSDYFRIEGEFQDAFGQQISFCSQADLVADSLSDYLARHPAMLGTGTENKFLTTGDTGKVSDLATQFLRRRVEFMAA